ncbi:uroporphyrinogen-III C-methyltransferase [Leeia sp. TBRC 13508]|uniref:Uroporphyrinogen-III C-methyltransferase n=1 Tax=Leeia speluncae TaxID=2884804 RepID=A0ABS8D3J1_9NEIS|nr:uroporphyrinogen-III C-methyltransferase [Leeia speluncae]MCB6182774.1 uroporphyrinogen-III C-methyltransferase [Leeia speluncae]
MSLPLTGKRILITRPVDQATESMNLVRELGGEPILLPLLEISPVKDKGEILKAGLQLASAYAVIFVSPNAVQFALDSLPKGKDWPAATLAIAVGKSTAERLIEAGIPNVYYPLSSSDTEGVLAMPELQTIDKQFIYIFRGQDGRPDLGDQLTARGARIQYVCCYLRTPPTDLTHRLSVQLSSKSPDAIVITSSEAGRHLFAAVGENYAKQLQSILICTTHPRIAQTIKPFGARVVTAQDDRSLLLALADVLKSPLNDRQPNETAMSENQEPTQNTASQTNFGNKLIEKLNPTLIVALVALGIIALQWADNRKQLTNAQLEVGKKLAQSEAFLQQSRAQISVLEKDRQDERVRLAVVESKLAEAQTQQSALNNLYQDLSQHRDNLVLAEIEQLLMAASQQLQIADNPRAALVALEGAQSRLLGFDSLRFNPLRQAVAKDIEALKALPDIDSEGMTLKLNNLLTNIDSLPFIIDVTPKAKPAAAKPLASDAPWYKRLSNEVWGEMKDVIRIRRLDKQDVPLLPPEQMYFVRENIKLHLLAAKVALLQRDQNSFRNDLTAARAILYSYFDRQAGEVTRSIQTIDRLNATDIHVSLPDLAQSLTALSNLKAAQAEIPATPAAGDKAQ